VRDSLGAGGRGILPVCTVLAISKDNSDTED
jgi:hypothetical protein